MTLIHCSQKIPQIKQIIHIFLYKNSEVKKINQIKIIMFVQ